MHARRVTKTVIRSLRFFRGRRPASLAIPPAEADISVLAIATYTTDYLLIKEKNVERALQVPEQADHYIDQ